MIYSYLTVVTCAGKRAHSSILGAGKYAHQQFTCAQVNMHISGLGSPSKHARQRFR